MANSSFGLADYYPNNFNDVASGIVTLFELLIVNNWFVISSGFEAVTPTWWARLYFISFWVVGVLICLNVVVAFAIDSFLSNSSDESEQVIRAGSTSSRKQKQQQEQQQRQQQEQQ